MQNISFSVGLGILSSLSVLFVCFVGFVWFSVHLVLSVGGFFCLFGWLVCVSLMI